MKYRILFSIYTGGYPNQFTGGPNNIIYKIIKYSNEARINFDFLSRDLFASSLIPNNIDYSKKEMTPKKKIASYLAEYSYFYRKIFSSDIYLQYHFYKNEKYYEAFSKKINSYNIVHSHDSIALAYLGNKNFKGKRILTIHSKGTLSDELKETLKKKTIKKRIEEKLKKLELKSIAETDFFTFPSIAAKNYFEKSLNVALPEEKIKIIYNGIEFEKIQNIKENNILKKYSINNRNKLTLLNVAAYGKEKRIDILLRIVQTIKNKYNKNILLVNIGERNDTKELKKLIVELNIQSNVKFLGKIPNEDVIRFLKATDVFIMTSEKVIFDLVVLEALASRACCVVSNDGGNKEIIKDGINGYLINPNNVEESAKKIVTVNKHAVKENAVKTAKLFSVQKMVDEYLDLYKDILNGI